MSFCVYGIRRHKRRKFYGTSRRVKFNFKEEKSLQLSKILSLFITFIPMTTGFLIFANGIFGKMKSIMGILFLYFCLMDLKGEPLMRKIVFEPQAWNELEFNWNEYVWSANENPCSPDIGAWEKKNMLLI